VEIYLLLGAKARRDGQPLIRPKVHIFWRGLQGFYRCTNPNCGLLYTEFADTCVTCHARCLPVELCRSCGQDFYRAYPDDAETDLDALLKKRKAKRKKTEDLPSSFILADEVLYNALPVHFTHNLYDNTETSDEEADVESEEGHAQQVAALYCAACSRLFVGSAFGCDCERREAVREDARMARCAENLPRKDSQMSGVRRCLWRWHGSGHADAVGHDGQHQHPGRSDFSMPDARTTAATDVLR
jgi:hypothetical protein